MSTFEPTVPTWHLLLCLLQCTLAICPPRLRYILALSHKTFEFNSIFVFKSGVTQSLHGLGKVNLVTKLTQVTWQNLHIQLLPPALLTPEPKLGPSHRMQMSFLFFPRAISLPEFPAHHATKRRSLSLLGLPDGKI